MSKNQVAHVEELFDGSDSPRSKRVLLEGWERFHEPVTASWAIGPLEHVGYDRYDAFFEKDVRAVAGRWQRFLLHTDYETLGEGNSSSPACR